MDTLESLLELSESGASTSNNLPTENEILWVDQNETTEDSFSIKIVCLWGQCSMKFDTVSELESHLDEHMNGYSTSSADR